MTRNSFFKLFTLDSLVALLSKSKAQAGITNGQMIYSLAADQSVSSSVAVVDITGLGVPVISGNTYFFEFYFPWSNAGGVGGVRFAINGPAMTSYRANYEVICVVDNTVVNVSNTQSTVNTEFSGATGKTGDWLIVMRGTVTPSASGTLVPRFAQSASHSTATIAKRGTMFRVTPIS